jgi:hypothetical protein
VLIGIAAAAVVLALGIGLIVYLVRRGPGDVEINRRDFDQTYDELVAAGDAADGDRDASWREFHAWQLQQEQERLAQDEAAEE